MGINLMADLGFDETAQDVKDARSAARVYAEVIDRLVACRKEGGLNQKQVARLMGTTQSAISDFESVNSDARFSTIIRYAQAVDCDVVIELEPHSNSSASSWAEVKIVKAANVSPFPSTRYRHIQERIEGLSAVAMCAERELVRS